MECLRKRVSHLSERMLRRRTGKESSSGRKSLAIPARMGWSTLKNGKKKVMSGNVDPYERGFHCSLFLRKSCYACAFAELPRTADVTLGDFWGLEKYDPALTDPRGVSPGAVQTARKAGGTVERGKRRAGFLYSGAGGCGAETQPVPGKQPESQGKRTVFQTSSGAWV